MSRALSGPATARRTGARFTDPRLCPRARRLGALAPPRPAQGDLLFELTDAAAEALSRTKVPAHWNAEQHTEPMAATRLRSLFECLGWVPECRHDRGKRYPLNTIHGSRRRGP